jgi:hypothetical protein
MVLNVNKTDSMIYILQKLDPKNMWKLLNILNANL